MRLNFSELKESHLDLQARSMRGNFIFTGIPETGPDEIPEQSLVTFIEKEMEIEQTEKDIACLRQTVYRWNFV